MTKLKVGVDRNRCMGAGECVFSAPHSFSLDEEGKAVFKESDLDSDDLIQVAVRGCPNFAIRLRSGEEVKT